MSGRIAGANGTEMVRTRPFPAKAIASVELQSRSAQSIIGATLSRRDRAGVSLDVSPFRFVVCVSPQPCTTLRVPY